MGAKLFSDGVETHVRVEVARLWDEELARLRPALMQDLDLAKSKMRLHLEPRPFQSDPSVAF